MAPWIVWAQQDVALWWRPWEQMGTLAWTLWCALLLAAGIAVLLPNGRPVTLRRKITGGTLGALGLLLLWWHIPALAGAGTATAFWMFAALTVFSAVAAVCSRSPIYCAIWFAVSLLGTAGLMLLQGAQFLGLATAAVYAGAIVVTFLFLLMLSQPEGDTYYDRITWGRRVRVVASMMTALMAVLVVGQVHQALEKMEAFAANSAPVRQTLESGSTATADGAADKVGLGERRKPGAIGSQEHVAVLGGQLFGRHLIAVQVAATLLLAALVAAIAIVSRDHLLQSSHGGPSG